MEMYERVVGLRAFVLPSFGSRGLRAFSESRRVLCVVEVVISEVDVMRWHSPRKHENATRRAERARRPRSAEGHWPEPVVQVVIFETDRSAVGAHGWYVTGGAAGW
jgi:hypothetical protein